MASNPNKKTRRRKLVVEAVFDDDQNERLWEDVYAYLDSLEASSTKVDSPMSKHL